MLFFLDVHLDILQNRLVLIDPVLRGENLRSFVEISTYGGPRSNSGDSS